MVKREKRSLRNIVLTAKHHNAYLGNWVLISLSLLGFVYLLILYHLHSLSQSELAPHLLGVVVGATILAGVLAGLVGVYGVLTAHRIAGVHIKIKNVLDQVKEGRLDTRVRFRAYDKLDEVEQAFNSMMDVLQTRLERAEGRTKP